jgi:hypothetical protein
LTADFFADAGLRDRNACVIVFEPARMAVRVMAVSVRWNERLQSGFRIRFGIGFVFTSM